MARNEEKAMNLFNKWQTFKKDYHAKDANRRPLAASECESSIDAEKFRREILKELTRKTALIQNATLGEFKIRDLNDEINKLMKKKHYWEIRIRELGGNDYKRAGHKQHFEIEGKELPGQPGYRYYGAAKDLPGVRELFAEEQKKEEYKKKVVQEARKRLLQDHADKLQGFLPAGTFQSKDEFSNYNTTNTTNSPNKNFSSTNPYR